jgi:hypothetical protein
MNELYITNNNIIFIILNILLFSVIIYILLGKNKEGFIKRRVNNTGVNDIETESEKDVKKSPFGKGLKSNIINLYTEDDLNKFKKVKSELDQLVEETNQFRQQTTQMENQTKEIEKETQEILTEITELEKIFESIKDF